MTGRSFWALFLCLLVGYADSLGSITGYVMLSRSENGQVVGLGELKDLALSAASLPVTRVIIGFFSPTLVYIPGSKTLQYAGLDASSSGDYGFAEIQADIALFRAAGVEVFLSLGGWNYNCYPYLYARYSVGGYGTNTPNYWKINQYGGGNINNCVESNQYCYVCEPPAEGTSLSDFYIFPEPANSTTWQQATKYVAARAGGGSPVWNYDMVPGYQWTDPKTQITSTVPGSNLYVQLNRDPYQDMVYLANELGADGIDLDYEEFWHADYYKTGSGPWNLTQTVYKYAAIAQDLIINIQAIAPKLRLTTAAPAVGALNGDWWGGNLKGLLWHTKLWFPEVIGNLSLGGINVMTYDLSDNEQYYECPAPGVCTLDQQVQYYMSSYAQAGIANSFVGYEVGTPAYPDPTEDPTHQLPLTLTELQIITSTTQRSFSGGFFWEMYKSADSSSNASPTQVAQAICNVVSPGSPRCSGVIPPYTPSV